jgi:predicted enzyme related to lactoylglutathione lyase
MSGGHGCFLSCLPPHHASQSATFQISLQQLPSPELEMWAFPMDQVAPGCRGALAKMDGKDSGVGGTIIYFTCADIR